MNHNKLLLQYALRFRWWILLSLFFGFSGAFFNSIGITLIIPIVLSILDPTLLDINNFPPILSQPFSFFDSFSGNMRVGLMLSTIILIIILKNINNVLNSLSSSWLTKRLANSIRDDLFKIVMAVDLDFFQRTKTGTLMSYLETECSRTATSINTAIGMMSIGFNLLTFTAILFTISWQLTLITGALLFLLSRSNQIFVRRSKELGREQRRIARTYTQKLVETLSGIRLVKSVSQEDNEYQNLVDLIHAREEAALKVQYNNVFIQPLNEIGGICIILGIVIIGKLTFQEDAATLVPLLLTFLILLFRAVPLVAQIDNKRNAFANQSSSVEVIHAFLDKSDKPFLPQGDVEFSSLQKGFELNNLNFHYPAHDNLVLRDINLLIPKGKVTALVGSSGSGKSTLGDLFVRFYDPSEGEILIDGIDYREYNLKSVRDKMAIVSQDTFLFNNTVRFNVCYGMNNVSEEDLINALKQANAYNFVMDLPRQLETEIGDRGVLLSGGQKQRIAIARALLRDPQILLLDEATSALDTVSEKIVQDALNTLSKDRTTLVIAHRLSTIYDADQIVALEKGEIVEIGTHQELLAKKGYYAKLHSLQFNNTIPIMDNELEKENQIHNPW
ncbi:ABC transporter ATP-binding protein/permease [Cyanobacterium stanieri LEGE 03274]|uniref:ABC transporter ATP-binding protein/permease n=1 Tax=Cyanobacterium stanieri LEGE 03274 TaxID=1828756 RepID=A0ABR9UZM9_9CHRO|nr:ABC transporter ATP-binding protein/permease [Cyanobacterium stanieri]MBE9221098.1 ABC transporter ATP-binding protein/permease [Cyanobacterium stanieri LEGE 03274]